MKKVLFVEPKTEFNAYRLLSIPLVGPLILATILKKQGHQVKVIAEAQRPLCDDEGGSLSPEVLEADVLAISIMTATANRGYLLAQAARRARPDIRIIIGGPHASLIPDEAAKYANLVVTGPGEEVICRAVEGDEEGILAGPQVEDLDGLPFVDIEVMDEPGRIHYFPISTSRGCPFKCNFCSVSAIFGSKYYFRSPENVMDEIELRLSQGFSKIFFCDDNFAANKSRAKNILEEILRRELHFRWVAECRPDVALDEELLDLMAKTRCRYVFIGFESFNPKTLRILNKRQGVEDIERCIRRLKERGIMVHGLFMLGADEDDLDSIAHTVRRSRDMGIDSAQFAILFPIPGTPLYEDLDSQGRIFSKDWSKYDGTHVVFEPRLMTALQLQEKALWAWRKFYSISKVRDFFVLKILMKEWYKINKGFMKWLRERERGVVSAS